MDFYGIIVLMKHKKENKKKLSLKEAYPSLAKEWHPEKDVRRTMLRPRMLFMSGGDAI
jgi:hypothetical protein